jgi:hypothetical protein
MRAIRQELTKASPMKNQAEVLSGEDVVKELCVVRSHEATLASKSFIVIEGGGR